MLVETGANRGLVGAAASCRLPIYQFHAWLRGISPLIWRRLLVRSDQTVADLHYALQLAFDWSDSHLNTFRIQGKDFGVYRLGGPVFDEDAQKEKRSAWRFSSSP